MPAEMETIRLAARPPRAADVAAMLAVYGDRSVASQAVMAALGFGYERDVEHLGDPHRLYRRRRPGRAAADAASGSRVAR